MKDEKAAFSERLREAMRAQELKPTPAVLEKLFNTQYPGKSVTIQSVAAWLGGRSIPKQDKLRLLADMLGMEPQLLHYGTQSEPQSSPSLVGHNPGLNPQDRAIVSALLALPPARRKLIAELIRAIK